MNPRFAPYAHVHRPVRLYRIRKGVLASPWQDAVQPRLQNVRNEASPTFARTSAHPLPMPCLRRDLVAGNLSVARFKETRFAAQLTMCGPLADSFAALHEMRGAKALGLRGVALGNRMTARNEP